MLLRRLMHSWPELYHGIINRQIARQKEVGWTEYWDFLDCFCDLSCPEGLQQLEHYLAGLAGSSSTETEVDRAAETIASLNISNNGDLSPEKHSPKLTRTLPSSFVTPVKSGWLRHDAVDTPDFLTGLVTSSRGGSVFLLYHCLYLGAC